MRLVLDTNVVFSGTITTDGSSHRVLKACLSRGKGPQLVYSKPIYNEYERKLGEKGKDYGVSESDRIFFLRMIRERGKLVEPEENLRIVEEDPDDDKFFECAVAGGAELIVSGDPHVLDVGKFGEIRCISPRKASEIIRENF
ncbi:hypothetical protein AKJ57_00115 [candidate division MSBL1 archaeon SCGC-AAA259A05]|uniref:PIN domain-containing protein n=1 Tax=candidate division MSBL1 archaeon SCGC-AAA259A05 TaxID=1698259 RepID=A0A133UC02_9EURY|nr:hypothetical protein AKJ57_00115 [candidate division MSBL1 archaeon SCGC-AAA259A05]